MLDRLGRTIWAPYPAPLKGVFELTGQVVLDGVAEECPQMPQVGTPTHLFDFSTQDRLSPFENCRSVDFVNQAIPSESNQRIRGHPIGNLQTMSTQGPPHQIQSALSHTKDAHHLRQPELTTHIPRHRLDTA